MVPWWEIRSGSLWCQRFHTTNIILIWQGFHVKTIAASTEAINILRELDLTKRQDPVSSNKLVKIIITHTSLEKFSSQNAWTLRHCQVYCQHPTISLFQVGTTFQSNTSNKLLNLSHVNQDTSLSQSNDCKASCQTSTPQSCNACAWTTITHQS